MTVDVFTLLLVIIVSSVVVSGTLLVLNGGQRRDGLQYWAAGLLLIAVGYALFMARGRIPDSLSVVLANALLAAGQVGFLWAVRCFHGLPLGWWRAVVPVLAMAVLMWVFHDNFAARVAVSGFGLALQIGWILLTLLRHPARQEAEISRGVLLLAGGLALEVVMALVRGSLALFFSLNIASILQGNALQTITFMVAFTTLQVTSFGFIFMAKERADNANACLAAQDALTGIANRRALMLALERKLARAVRQRTPLTLLMLDIDHFKRVNDQYGHLAGDQVLRHVVQVVGQRLRAQDFLGRYGGEEFLVLLPHTDLAGAQQLGQQLCEAVQASSCDWYGQRIAVTVSVGISGCVVGTQPDWETLLLAADRALYRAKENGRNRVEVAGLPQQTEATEA